MVVDSDGYLVKAGDILSFHRSSYVHVALAVDGDYAVHLTGDDNDFDIDILLGSSVRGTHAVIKREKIMKIAGDSKFFVANDVWRKSTRSREEVVRRARDRVGKPVKYNLVTFNCEHFVNYLVTGTASSQQIETAGTAAAAALGATVGVGIIVGAAYLISRLFTSNDEEEEEQVA